MIVVVDGGLAALVGWGVADAGRRAVMTRRANGMVRIMMTRDEMDECGWSKDVVMWREEKGMDGMRCGGVVLNGRRAFYSRRRKGWSI